MDGLYELGRRADICEGHAKSCEVHDRLGELKLLRRECDSIAITQIAPIAQLKKGCLNISTPFERVINALDLVWKVRDDRVKALIVAITAGYETLRGDLVTVTTPRGYKGRQVAIIRV